MITEDYVSFETAKLMKEKGFDENTICKYADVGGITEKWYDDYRERIVRFDWEEGYLIEPLRESKDQYEIIGNTISAPTIQMALKWIRMKGFHIFVPLEIDYDEDERGDKWYHDAAYYPEIRRVSDGKIMYDDGSLYAEPEQAAEAAIKFCLENLI